MQGHPNLSASADRRYYRSDASALPLASPDIKQMCRAVEPRLRKRKILDAAFCNLVKTCPAIASRDLRRDLLLIRLIAEFDERGCG